LTQLDLAATCGFDESAIGRLENGNTNPTIKTLLKIAKSLDVKLIDLVRVK
jgi:transcriptional regulator with XRE-family HTH domain